MREPRRADGYAPLRDYAAIGDGRTVALVALDGTIDWLCLPDLDSPAVLCSLLDARAGGSFALAPGEPFRVTRAYLPGTNVLETTFATAGGSARVTDAMTLPAAGLAPHREVVRAVDGLSGEVTLRWRFRPRAGFASWRTRIRMRDGLAVATARSDALAVVAHGAPPGAVDGDAVAGAVTVRGGERALLVLTSARGEPLVVPSRDQAEARLAATVAFWERWTATLLYDGPWREQVLRSALALKLLVFAQSGAVAAAATTSLPEEIGGARNWDYRFAWVRDSAFTLDALLDLGCADEARSFFWWLLHAQRLRRPGLSVLYRLDGGLRLGERTLPLEGYRGSRPVRVGNAAAGQTQLDIYGSLVTTAWLFAREGYVLDPDVGRVVAAITDEVAAAWPRPDAGIWEVRSEERQFTQSKMMCWVALDRAARLGRRGLIPAGRVPAWEAAARAVRDFVERECWSERVGAYTRAAGADELDASVLVAAILGYGPASHPRMRATIAAIRSDLADGPLVRRYGGEDGVAGTEGAFLTCSFWLADALARSGRAGQAEVLMEELVGLANDVGLYAEEIDPGTRDFLGNMPQALTHLALINAARSIGAARAQAARPRGQE